jgi:predicted DCC family thiol-disulfide oxidoreductase YuxK
VFRIVFFGCLFNSINTSEIVWFSQLPPELKFAPTGLGWLLSYLPINQTLAGASSTLLRVFSLTAMIGLFARTSAVLTVILGVYALGIPQFFGKVNHYHHLLWFAAILAVSRCADVFSCDAIRAAWKRADRGIVEPPAASQAYALPLRFVWLLIGIIYFFPGFWKVCLSGFDWAFSENFKLQLHNKWSELDGWMPFFRLDQYPLLYRLSALGAIIFELSFIFLIFFPRLRLLAALGGIMFHSAINTFMHISSFWTLQASYIAFFNWNAIFLRVGRWLYQEEMYLIYDGNCQLCRRTIASLRVFDTFGRVTYVNALDDVALTSHQLDWLDFDAILADMHVVVQRKAWIGFSAYRVLAARIILLWPILPLLYVWPIPRIGRRIYRRVADSRTCSISTPPPEGAGLGPVRTHRANQRLRSRAVMLVGIFLLSINSLCGMVGVYRAWPFALYPPFAILAEAQRESLEIVPLDSSGKTIPFDQQALKQKFSSDRFEGLTSSILGTGKQALRQQFASDWVEGLISSILGSVDSPAQTRIRLNAFWQVAVQNDPKLQQADSVRFYKVTRWTAPERQKENPVNQELIFELKL